MPTNAEIKALIQKEVRQQRSHLVRNGLADILDAIIDNIGAGPGGVPGIDEVLAAGDEITENRYIEINETSTFAIQKGDNDYVGYFSWNQSYLLNTDPTGLTNFGKLTANAANDKGEFIAEGSFNGGETTCFIQGTAESGSSTMQYAADKHIIRRVQEYANNAAAVVVVGDNGLYYTTVSGERILKLAYEEE